MSAKILENDVHVYVVSWRTQEVLAYRDLKTNEIAVGDENKIQQVGYVAVLTRVAEELDNEETGGWKVIDVSFYRVLPLPRGHPAHPYGFGTDGSSRRIDSRIPPAARRALHLNFSLYQQWARTPHLGCGTRLVAHNPSPPLSSLPPPRNDIYLACCRSPLPALRAAFSSRVATLAHHPHLLHPLFPSEIFLRSHWNLQDAPA